MHSLREYIANSGLNATEVEHLRVVWRCRIKHSTFEVCFIISYSTSGRY
nr:MAG TPA: hypothetical protein [Caudoviricetes sp.]